MERRGGDSVGDELNAVSFVVETDRELACLREVRPEWPELRIVDEAVHCSVLVTPSEIDFDGEDVVE